MKAFGDFGNEVVRMLKKEMNQRRMGYQVHVKVRYCGPRKEIMGEGDPSTNESLFHSPDRTSTEFTLQNHLSMTGCLPSEDCFHLE